MTVLTGNGAPATRRGPLHDTVAAALTPLRAEGRELDLEAIWPLTDLYAAAGVTGVFVGGTTGESLMLSLAERRQMAEEFIAAARGRLAVAVSAGAQTTADTLVLAEHAANCGAAAVAVAPPPFFAFDAPALLAHLSAAAARCAPVPFYLYEIRQRTGYAIPVTVVQALLDRAPNFVGMKVSDPTLEEVQRYLLPGLDVMIGAEGLVAEGLARGAVGAVSGLAGALPRHVARAVREGPVDGTMPLGALRTGLERFPFHAAGKLALIAQHIPVQPWVRAPLRQLTPAERTELEDWLAASVLRQSVVSADVSGDGTSLQTRRADADT